MQKDQGITKLLNNLNLPEFNLGNSRIISFNEKMENNQLVWYFSFYLDREIVDDEIEQKFHQALVNKLNTANIKVKTKYQYEASAVIKDDQVHDLWPTIKTILIEISPALINLPNVIKASNGELEIIVASNTEKDLIEFYSKQINDFYLDKNILINKIKVIVDENSIDLQKLKFTNYEQTRTNTIIQQSAVKVVEQVKISGEITKLNKITKPGTYVVEGMVFDKEIREIKTKDNRQFTIGVLKITDFTTALQIKKFLNPQQKALFSKIKTNDWLKVEGKVSNDAFAKELVMDLNNFEIIDAQTLNSELTKMQRYEMHVHSKMSVVEGISQTKEYFASAQKLGIKGLAFTDNGNVQIFPEVEQIAKNYPDIKVMYGTEVGVIGETKPILNDKYANNKVADLNQLNFLVFDIETTGFSARFDNIIEIAMVNYQDQSKFTMFANPGYPIPRIITQLTNITDEMVSDAVSEKELLEDLIEFISKVPNCCLVAHNADFDCDFLKEKCAFYGLQMPSFYYLDTLELSRNLHPEDKRHGLAALVKKYKVKLDSHHRAIDDTIALTTIFEKQLSELKVPFDQINKLVNNEQFNTTKNFKLQYSNKLTLLVQSQKGLKNLFKIVSMGLTTKFANGQKLHLEDIFKNREGLLIGSNFEEGYFFELLINKSYNAAKQFAKNLDYLELMPIEQLYYKIDNGSIRARYILKQVYHDILKIGQELNLPVIGSSRPYHTYTYQKMNRKIYTDSISNIHRYRSNNLTLEQFPDNSLWTPTQMKNSFANILNDQLAELVVFSNVEKLVAKIDKIKIIKDQLFAPEVTDVMSKEEQDIRKIAYDKAYQIYGKNLPTIVVERLEKELQSIIEHKFDVVYLISMKLVKQSLKDGYLVGSRGSVGSSLVATMLEITEVNPLPPHYICTECHNCEFVTDGSYACGFDLPTKQCSCGSIYRKEGHDIPFETFLGFKGDKVPDIDLNFSGEYQAIAHRFVREIFGAAHAFRAGTISSVAEKTAYGYAKNFEKENQLTLSNTHIDFLIKDLAGTKKTTGQHPGGIIVVPKDMEIYDITPIQFPADDVNAEWQTTHFDFHAIHDNLLKLDILGHDDPTIIRFLLDKIDYNLQNIDFSNERVLKLFNSIESLSLNANPMNWSVGTLAIPEFGTFFVREMLKDVNAQKFSDLVQISGLSHGTDVWLGNAKDLINQKICTISDVIGCRDDIMVKLMQYGIESSLAFNIMEDVRKGKGLTDEYIQEMKNKGVPDWYIESCQKIKYMFPKAHATAYVMMAFRIAYFKVEFPLAFYSAFFSIKADQFHLVSMQSGVEAILSQIELVRENPKPTAKDTAILLSLEVALEMILRGYKFLELSLTKSKAKEFVIEPNVGLYPSFSAVEGLGEAAALSIEIAREEKMFSSIEDFKNRTKVNNTVINKLKELGVFNDLPNEEE